MAEPEKAKGFEKKRVPQDDGYWLINSLATVIQNTTGKNFRVTHWGNQGYEVEGDPDLVKEIDQRMRTEKEDARKRDLPRSLDKTRGSGQSSTSG